MRMKAKRMISAVLAFLLVLGMVPGWAAPVSAEESGTSALSVKEQVGAHYDVSVSKNYYKIISQRDYVLAEGVVESEITLNNSKGTRKQILSVIEVDANNPNILILPGYYGVDKDLENPDNWTAISVDKIMDYYHEELGYNVVAGINLSLTYNTNAPCSFFVFNGEVLASPEKGSPNVFDTYMAVIKKPDGSFTCELRDISTPLDGSEWQAVPCQFEFYLENGELVKTSKTSRSGGNSHSVLGVKADGTLVVLGCQGTNGSLASGLNTYEIGETMKALGCLWAVNCDGGGSTQVFTKREGDAEYVLRNLPDDGAPRAVTHGLLLGNRKQPDGKFDHIAMMPDLGVIAPEGNVNVELKGVDGGGGAVEIPADATFEVTGGTFEDGVFTSDGTLGEQTITAFDKNGKEIGSAKIEVVEPVDKSFTGLYKDGDVYRYAHMGTIQTGWQKIADDWYYFDPETKAAVSGKVKIDGVSFDFEDNGRLITGTWVTHSEGRRYHYGPGYYTELWGNVEGDFYYFEAGYALTGIRQIRKYGDFDAFVWTDLGEDGKFTGTYFEGFFEDGKGNLRYAVNGAHLVGLNKIDGDYYFFGSNGAAVKGQKYYAWETHCDLPCGNYEFGADGKMLRGIVEKDGALYFYNNGSIGTAGLTKYEGNYYFVSSSGKVVRDQSYNCWATNCDLPTGMYTFDADGKMIDAPAPEEDPSTPTEPESPTEPEVVKDGLVQEEDGLYYYVNGKLASSGLTKIGDDYYFITPKGKCAVGETNCWKTNCDLPIGVYEFGADGKLLEIPEVEEPTEPEPTEPEPTEPEPSEPEPSEPEPTEPEPTEPEPSEPSEPAVKNGLVQEENGIYYYIDGKFGPAGLTKIGDDYYFVSTIGRVATGLYYCWATNCDLPCNNYEFAADGKMLQGIVQKEDGPYYYVNGRIKNDKPGLTNIGDAHYFVSSIGRCAVGQYYCWATNCDLPVGPYEFGADGKMFQGIVQKEDGPYLYTNGRIDNSKPGLTKIGEDYYFVSAIGRCAVGSYFCWATNCDLPCGTYEFGSDGKLLNPPASEPDAPVKNGLVTQADGIYYYIDGVVGPAGLTKIGEDYYFVSSIGRVATGEYFCWATNCELPCGLYVFDEEGKMVR